MLGAFVSEATLHDADRALEARGYRTDEFGDSVLVERMASTATARPLQRHAR
jgi:hypothetical protein